MKERSEPNSVYDDSVLLQPETLSLSLGFKGTINSRNNRSKVIDCAQNVNLILDDNAPDSIECDRFARAVATMSRGTLKHSKTEYAAFRESLWESPTTNPAINNTHISSEYDYHEIETKKHWEKSSGNKSIFQSGTHLETKTFPTITVLLGADNREPYSHEGRNGNVKMFGRTRVTTPFARTKMNLFQEQSHSSVLLNRHTLREEAMSVFAPNPTTYHPYPDTWQKKTVCGVVKESSMFQSLSPSRMIPNDEKEQQKEQFNKSEKYIELAQNFTRPRPATTSAIREKNHLGGLGGFGGTLDPDSSGVDAMSRVSMSLFLSKKSGESSSNNRTPMNNLGNVLGNHGNLGNVHFDQGEDSDGRGRDGKDGKRDIRGLILRAHQSFDDSDGDDDHHHSRKKHHNAHNLNNHIGHIGHHRKGRKKDKNQDVINSLTDGSSDIIALTDNNKNNNNNNDNYDNPEIGFYPYNSASTILDLSGYNSDEKNSFEKKNLLIENLKQNRDYFLSLRGEEKFPKGKTIGKELRSSTWMCSPEKVRERESDRHDIFEKKVNFCESISPPSKPESAPSRGRSKSFQPASKAGTATSSLWSDELAAISIIERMGKTEKSGTNHLEKTGNNQLEKLGNNQPESGSGAGAGAEVGVGAGAGDKRENNEESHNRINMPAKSGLPNIDVSGNIYTTIDDSQPVSRMGSPGNPPRLGLGLDSPDSRINSRSGSFDQNHQHHQHHQLSLPLGMGLSQPSADNPPVSDISFHPRMRSPVHARTKGRGNNDHNFKLSNSKDAIYHIKNKANMSSDNSNNNTNNNNSEVTSPYGPTSNRIRTPKEPRPNTSPVTFDEFMPEVSSYSSSDLSKRPKTAPKLFEWQPKMYQSKSILQRKFENKEQLSLLALKEVEKFNSNMIHSSVAEYMPYSSRISKEDTERLEGGESGEEGKEGEGRGRGGGKEGFNTIITIKDRKKERKELNSKNNLGMRRMDSITSITSPKNEETYRNRLLLLPKNKGDCLGTHFTKKTDLKLVKNKNKNKNEIKDGNMNAKDALRKSDEILEKTSHLTRQDTSLLISDSRD